MVRLREPILAPFTETIAADRAGHVRSLDGAHVQRVAVLAGDGKNQDQAYLTAVPEPASMAVMAAGLVGLGGSVVQDRGQLEDLGDGAPVAKA